jgi:hypothetical protein
VPSIEPLKKHWAPRPWYWGIGVLDDSRSALYCKRRSSTTRVLEYSSSTYCTVSPCYSPSQADQYSSKNGLLRVQIQYPAGYIYFSSCFSSSSEPRRRLARKIFAVVACRWLSLNHVVDDVVLYQSHFLNCSMYTTCTNTVLYVPCSSAP